MYIINAPENITITSNNIIGIVVVVHGFYQLYAWGGIKIFNSENYQSYVEIHRMLDGDQVDRNLYITKVQMGQSRLEGSTKIIESNEYGRLIEGLTEFLN